MWEWRVFSELGGLAMPRALEGPAAEVDERHDLYFLLDDRDEAGLKLRGVQAPVSKCELKLRYERDEQGLELWEKVFDQRLPVDPVRVPVLARHLDVSADEALSIAAREDVPALVGKAREVLVQKRIVKAPFPPAYSIEYVELEVGGRALCSVSVEAATRALCLEHGRRAGLPPKSSTIITGGYPEALRRFSS